MHGYLYIQNNYIQHTQIYYVNTRLLFWMRLIAINFCTALILSELTRVNIVTCFSVVLNVNFFLNTEIMK